MLSPDAQESLKTLYSKGVADGMEIALSLLLGRRTSGGEPYRGNLDPGAAEWAMAALAAIHETKRKGKA